MQSSERPCRRSGLAAWNRRPGQPGCVRSLCDAPFLNLLVIMLKSQVNLRSRHCMQRIPEQRGLKTMTVGEVAARSGVAVSTLHFYEAQGLIHSERNRG